jgi:putative metalloprotease
MARDAVPRAPWDIFHKKKGRGALAMARSAPHIWVMLKMTPIILAVLYGLGWYMFSAWRTNRMLDEQSTELADPKLKRLTDRLAAALDLEKIRVFIFEIDPVNGLAAPDGRIFITRGFYRKFQTGEVTGEELAGVIAHELGHVALGHAKRRAFDFSGQNALRTALMMVLGRYVPVIGPMVAGMLTNLLAARLSRSDEYEADAYAAALLTKAGIGIEPQKSLFQKLEALTQSRAGMAPAWLMSHPKTTDRINALEALEARWQA